MLAVDDDITFALVVVLKLADNALLLLLSEHVHLLALAFAQEHPGMGQDLVRGQPLGRIFLQDALQQGESILADLLFFVRRLSLQDILVQLGHIAGFKGHSAEKHGVENDSSGPDIRCEALVTLILEDFGRDVGRSPALLRHSLTGCHQLGHSKIADLHIALACQQDVVQFDVPVQDVLSMAICQARHDLFE